jgi:hypothetical protein
MVEAADRRRDPRATVRRVLLAVVAGVIVALLTIALPVHVTPGGGGSLRCAHSSLGRSTEGHSEGLGEICADAVDERVRVAALIGVGMAAMVVSAVGPRRTRAITFGLGAVLVGAGAFGVVGNLLG